MKDSYLSIFLTFLRFGLLAWGGPVAQINMLREELVMQKGWITPEKFKRVLAVYQALPGPEAHEMCVYFGMVRGGRIAGLLAGLGFMVPGLALMLIVSWAYTQFGAAALLPLFVGVAPAVAALIVRAAHRIGGHVVHGDGLKIAFILAIALTVLGVHFFITFAICAIWNVLYDKGKLTLAIALTLLLSAMAWGTPQLVSLPIMFPSNASNSLFLEGLRAGMLSFGGAYTAIPFLQERMVDTYPAITQQSFLDGIALANIIPAPLVIFGTFLGFLADGFSGALWVTAGIFLPAFAFTLLGHHQLEKLIENPSLHATLDGISAAVVGLLVITAFYILIYAVASPLQMVIFAAALASLYVWKWKWSIPAMILICGAIGFILTHFQLG